MQITELVRRGKSELYKTFVDGEYVCLLEAETIVKNKLKTGQEIDENKFNEIRQESEKLTCKNVAISYVSKALKTKKQVEANLKQKGFLLQSIDYAISKLCDYGYINDRYYAECFVKTKTQKGKLYLKNALKTKGISDSIINEVLLDYETDEDQLKNLAYKFIKNKPCDDKLRQKLYRHLISKGFEFGEVQRVVNQVLSGDSDDWDWCTRNRKSERFWK